MTKSVTGQVGILPLPALQVVPDPIKPGDVCSSLPVANNDQVDFVTVIVPDATATTSSETTTLLWSHQLTSRHCSVSIPTPTLTTSPLLVERPFITGHGPVVNSKPTSSASLSIEGHSFTFQHESVAGSTSGLSHNVRQEHIDSAVSIAASTLATVVEKSFTMTNVPNITDNTSNNIGKASKHILKHTFYKNCHNNGSDYIYFTLLLPNDLLALDSEGYRVLYHI